MRSLPATTGTVHPDKYASAVAIERFLNKLIDGGEDLRDWYFGPSHAEFIVGHPERLRRQRWAQINRERIASEYVSPAERPEVRKGGYYATTRQTRRDMVAAHANGMSYSQISKVYGVSLGCAQKTCAAARERAAS